VKQAKGRSKAKAAFDSIFTFALFLLTFAFFRAAFLLLSFELFAVECRISQGEAEESR
jgi:hypothetical protein